MYLKIDTLTQTVCNHDVPMVTVTAQSDKNPLQLSPSSLSSTDTPLCDRRIVVLTSRVHPGETNSSWIMHGLLDFLTGDSAEARLLRATYVFKIVPMLNVEGVINGSHRCGLTGDDLNRRWRNPSPTMHPAIYNTKGIMSYIRQVLDRDIFLYCDFHGHSRKKNVFLYGCSSAQSWWQLDHEFEEDPSHFTVTLEIVN